ncbi:MAG: hypothetical protein GC178_11165 [Flavobacteriales bacterium]|nr:hypothetical protein [Flavobacteriales bacterium]
MSFLQRFGYYLFGVALGSMLVYVWLIRGRDFPAWTPSGRVLQELAVDSVVIDPGVHLPFADSLLVQHIKACDVKFDESVVRDVPCKEYQLESEKERMRFKVCRSEIRLYEYDPK